MTDMDKDSQAGNGVVITFREIYAEMQRLVGELRDVNIAIKSHEKRSDDLEQRVRALEKWRYALPVALIISVGSVIVTVLVHR